MRYCIFLGLLFFWYIGFTQNPTYRPLLDPQRSWLGVTSWAYEQCNMYLPPNSDCQTRALYFLQGDTVIQGTAYQKCIRQDFSIASSWDVIFNLSAPVFHAALREDTLDRKVYLFDAESETEKLLYDFSMTIGDTAYVAAAGNSEYKMVVDSVMVLPDGRKKWIINQYQEMVEGIGMGEGLFPAPICFEVCHYLACVQDNGIPIFNADNWPYHIFSSGPACGYTTSANEVSASIPMRVYPNPSSAIFEVTEWPEGVEVAVFDQNGRRVTGTISGNQVDLGGVPTGLYWIKAGDRVWKVIKR